MRVCGMMRRAISNIQPWLLVLMIVLPSTYSECPSDVMASANQCLFDYEVHSAPQSDDLGQINFYTGIDTENIRSICKSLTKSVKCVLQIQNSCPPREHSQIHLVVAADGPLVNVAKLCQYRDVYELYSRHQYCYARIEAESDACYKDFTRETSSLRSGVEAKNHHSMQTYCRHLDTMVECVKSNFMTNCGSEAAEMARVLVESSIINSSSCSSLKEAAQQTTTASHLSRSTVSGGLHDSRVGSGADSTNMKRPLVWSALLTLVSYLISISRSS